MSDGICISTECSVRPLHCGAPIRHGSHPLLTGSLCSGEPCQLTKKEFDTLMDAEQNAPAPTAPSDPAFVAREPTDAEKLQSMVAADMARMMSDAVLSLVAAGMMTIDQAIDATRLGVERAYSYVRALDKKKRDAEQAASAGTE